MLPLKNNIGPDQTGFSFKIESISLGNGIDTSRIAWDSAAVTVTADDVLATESSPSDDRSALEDAKDFLFEMLAPGPVEGKAIYRQANDAGHSKRTIDRAKRELSIRSSKATMSGPWRWELPTKVAKDTEHCHEKAMATFGDVGNLRAPNATTEVGDAEVF